MRFLILIVLIAAIGGGYYVYSNREGPAEKAGAVLDEAIDKGKRIINIVNE